MSIESGAMAVAVAMLVLVWSAIALAFRGLRRRTAAGGHRGRVGRAGPATPAGADVSSPDEPRRRGPRLDLPGRLHAAAGLVGAAGLVVWTGDDEGAQLQVVAAHGYSDAFLDRISPVQARARVLTALAFAERRPCRRAGGDGRPAAAALPIERDGEVVGVLTAEFDAEPGAQVPPEAEALLRLVAVQAARWLPASARPATGTASVAAPTRIATAARAVRSTAIEAPREATTGEAATSVPLLARPASTAFEPITVTVRVADPVRPAAPPETALPADATPEDDAEATLREARSRFVAGFRRRSATIEEQITRMATEGATGPALAIRPIVHRMAGLAIIVGMPQVSQRATDLDRLLEHAAGEADLAAIRQAFVALQDAFTADLASLPPLWAGPTEAVRGSHVLVVAGEAALADRLAADLRTNGYRVSVAGSGVRALALAREDRPGVVLLDVTLGGEPGGHDVCRRLKGDATLADIPVVLLAARASTAERMAGFALGADDFLTTPVETLELLLRVRWMLTRPVAQRGPAPKAGGGLMTADTFLVAARDALRQGPAALGLVRTTPSAVTELAVLFTDDLRRKDLLGRYSETQLAVLMPGATAGIAARRIGGVLDVARAAGLEAALAGVAATGQAPERFLEPLLAAAEAAQATAQVQRLPVAVHGAEARVARGTVLIVDDDPDVVHVIDARLKAAGLQTVVAFDGQAALHEVEVRAPAVVVLELLLPKRSGFDVLAGLRALPEPRPRVVVLSSRTREEDVMRAFELGADDYLTKPFSPQELLARVDRLLRAG